MCLFWKSIEGKREKTTTILVVEHTQRAFNGFMIIDKTNRTYFYFARKINRKWKTNYE